MSIRDTYKLSKPRYVKTVKAARKYVILELSYPKALIWLSGVQVRLGHSLFSRKFTSTKNEVHIP